MGAYTVLVIYIRPLREQLRKCFMSEYMKGEDESKRYKPMRKLLRGSQGKPYVYILRNVQIKRMGC